MLVRSSGSSAKGAVRTVATVSLTAALLSGLYALFVQLLRDETLAAVMVYILVLTAASFHGAVRR